MKRLLGAPEFTAKIKATSGLFHTLHCKNDNKAITPDKTDITDRLPGIQKVQPASESDSNTTKTITSVQTTDTI